MTIPQLSKNIEKPFRYALGHAARGEYDQLTSGLTALDEEVRSAATGLCILVAGYNALRICRGQWPDEPNLREMAEGTATVGTRAREAGLREEEVYAFLTRVCLRFEPPLDVFSNEDEQATIERIFIITAHFMATYCPRELSIWELLDQIEESLEIASALDLAVLPALMLRSRREAMLGQP